MVRRIGLPTLALALLGPLLLAFGSNQAGPPSDTIPRPKENIRAEIRDHQGVSTSVEFLSCGGRTFLPLERGAGTLMVPFSKIQRVEVGAEEEDRVAVSVDLGEGKRLEGSLSRTLLCTGATEFGNFQIEIRGTASILVGAR